MAGEQPTLVAGNPQTLVGRRVDNHEDLLWPRLLGDPRTPGPIGLREHLARYGSVPVYPSSGELIDLVRRAGLQGRGGSRFPTARKLESVACQPGRPIVVANGTEGEPASSKDKVLLARSPHLVLDGVAAAARAVGAAEAIVVCNPAVREIADQALAERRRASLDGVSIVVATAADGFVAGEARAVVQWLERGTPVPTASPARLSERGLHGRPTLVNNVETLAHFSLISRYGPDWFRALGTPAEPGSMLVTVLGAVRSPGVFEIPIGAAMEDVLAVADGVAADPQALLLGGYFGTWVSWQMAARRPFSREGLSPVAADPGAGLVAVLPRGACGLAETARVVRYLAGESAGQCGPCVFGLPAIAREFEQVAMGGRSDLARLQRWLTQVDGRGACSHPDGVARLARSALRVFASEVDRHSRGRCSASGPSRFLPVPASRQ